MSRWMISRLRAHILNWLLPRRAYKFFLIDWEPLEDLGRVADAMATLRQTARLEPAVVSAPTSRRIVVVAPHPDDESIGPGGTLVAASDRGAKIKVVVLSDEADAETAALRRQEAEVACRILRAAPVFLGFKQRAIPVDGPALTSFADAVASLDGKTGPDALFIPFFADDHDDHRRANELLLRAADGGQLFARPEIWAYQVYTSMPCNVFVDIAAHKAEKTRAIECHATQMARRDWVSVTLGLNAYNARFVRSRRSGLYEGFFVLPFDDYIGLLRRYFKKPTHECYRSSFYRGVPGPSAA